VFFIGNYLSHAATVKLPPATGVMENIWICFTALLMPAAGLYYGLSAFSQAILGRRKCEANQAAMAGALCMFVRSDKWQPPHNVSSFEADVHTLADFAKRVSPTDFRSPFPQSLSALMPQASRPSDAVHKMMSVYKDITTDRFRMRVFRRMEDVDKKRQRQRQLGTEGHEGEAEEGIEMMERCV
jgi:hypothetical protein